MKDINYWESIDETTQEEDDEIKNNICQKLNIMYDDMLSNIITTYPNIFMSRVGLDIEASRMWKEYYKAQIDHKEGTPKTWSDFHERYFRIFGHYTKEILKAYATLNNCDHKAWGLE